MRLLHMLILLLVVGPAALAGGYLIDVFLDHLPVLGQHIPQSDVRSDYLYGVV